MLILALAFLLALVASAVLCWSAASLERQVAPSVLVWLGTAAAVSTAVTSGCALTGVALAVIGRDAEIAETGRWSAATLHQLLPIPLWAGVAAAVIVAVLLTSALFHAARIGRALVTAQLLSRRLRADPGGTVIVEDDIPDAYAVAGIRGYVVVTTGMLRHLPPNEQAIVLAHEKSHLRRRHHLYVQLTDLAAAADPLLRPIAAAVRHGVERWADEDAAAAAGDRQLVARAIARAGLARARDTRTRQARLAVVSGRVADRAQALLTPPQPRRHWVPAALAGLIAAATVLTAVATATVHADFEHAEASVVHGETAGS